LDGAALSYMEKKYSQFFKTYSIVLYYKVSTELCDNKETLFQEEQTQFEEC